MILISLLAIFLEDDLQRLNATKNVLAMLVNGVAAIVFIDGQPHRLGRGRPGRR